MEQLLNYPLAYLAAACSYLVFPALLAYHLIRGPLPKKPLLGALGASLLMTLLLQTVIGRARPEAAFAFFPVPNFFAFPSGHAALCGALVAFTSLKKAPYNYLNWTLVAAICASRYYLGHHYPEDLIAGFALGAGIGAGAFGLSQTIPSQRPKWAWLLWFQLAMVFIAILSAYFGLLRIPSLAIPGLDKSLHFSMLGLLTFLLAGWNYSKPPLYIGLAVATISTIEEFLQQLSPHRSFDYLDMSCNLAGISLAVWLVGKALKLKTHHLKQASC